MIKDIEERFGLFRDMIQSINPIYITELDEDFNTIYTNNPKEELLTMLGSIQFMGNVPAAESFGSVSRHLTRPVIFANSLGMTWLSDVYLEEGDLKRIFILGPVFLDSYSLRRIEPEIDRTQLSIPHKHQFLTILRDLPVITLNRYYDFGIMLHRAITGEVITRSDFDYPEMDKEESAIEQTLRDYHGVYSAEQNLCRLIEEGNLQYIKEHDALLSVSDNVVSMKGDHLRQLKNVAIVLCTLFSRAAIRGEVEPETAYTMSDLYIQRIEEAGSYAKLRELIDEFTEAFVRAVYRHKIQTGISPQIKKACDYIGLHLEENISIQDVAQMLGYSDYYFSNKFKKETGTSFREYVRKKRIERSKDLLRDTNKDIHEIGLMLGYESASYFGEIFRKETGMSPGEYRSKEKRKTE